jgi:integrase
MDKDDKGQNRHSGQCSPSEAGPSHFVKIAGGDVGQRDTVFPRVSNQEVNRSLKILAEICGIQKYLTSHLARHTFATTVTLMNGVPIETISKMLGHTKISTTMLYAKVTQTKIGMDMNLLQNRLDKNKTVSALNVAKTGMTASAKPSSRPIFDILQGNPYAISQM